RWPHKISAMLILWGRGLLPIFNLNEQNFQTQKGRVKNDFSFFTRPFFKVFEVGWPILPTKPCLP
ncbi:MAG: hypothetical protein IJG52_07130, partial [Lachnospiraceae bacterium]|nr:hypothetical protein [Lachnospiraceae bacterium]